MQILVVAIGVAKYITEDIERWSSDYRCRINRTEEGLFEMQILKEFQKLL